MSSKVWITCLERCPYGGEIWLPGEYEVDAEQAKQMVAARKAFKPSRGRESRRDASDSAGLGDAVDSLPAPEKRRTKPAGAKRKG